MARKRGGLVFKHKGGKKRRGGKGKGKGKHGYIKVAAKGPRKV